jgi:predicted kinase
MVGSGKSTYARRRADEGAIVISHDDLTQMLHARYRYEQVLRDQYRAAEEKLAHVFLSAGRDVVIDRTHLTRESRKRWVDFTKWPNFAHDRVPVIAAVTFPIEAPEVHARRRVECDARGRSYDDWLRVAHHHYQQSVDEPLHAKDEGFDWIEGNRWRMPVDRGCEAPAAVALGCDR